PVILLFLQKMPPKNKTRPLSFVMQVDNQAQKNASKNPNIGTSKDVPIKRRRCPRHPRMVTTPISRAEEVLESTQVDPTREEHCLSTFNKR
ncbi:hypothetical protein Taro_028523, partial [Colocasia esculenta]|nr:hypothetical protein [Colocasia esculenta]